MSDIRFSNRVVVVTGAGSGLGKAYAFAFAQRGACVVVNDLGGARDGTGAGSDAADSVVEEIRRSGGDAVANYDTVATKEGGQRIIEAALDHYGRVDVLINNAGILRDKSLLKMSEEDWDLVLAVHLKGAFCVTQPAFAVMKKNGYGRIVTTTSGSGLYGNFGQANYMAAKMGLVGLMHSVGIEGEKYNIMCNAIAPVAASRMTDGLMPPDMLDRLKPEFITPLVLYLASEENRDTRMIYNCAAGWFSRTAVMCGTGVCLGNGKREISPEEIRDHWGEIMNLDDAKPLNNLVDSLRFITPFL